MRLEDKTIEHLKQMGPEVLRTSAEHYRRMRDEIARRIVDMESYVDDMNSIADQIDQVAFELENIVCGVATTRGLPCQRQVMYEGARCWQHQEWGYPWRTKGTGPPSKDDIRRP